MQEDIPGIDPALVPPTILGTATLAQRAFNGSGLNELLAFIWRVADSHAQRAAQLLDASMVHRLQFRPDSADALQRQALSADQLFRIACSQPQGRQQLRLLAIVAPGDLMVNTPLDFLVAELDVQLDLLFVCPNQPLPSTMPEHDVAFCAVSESVPALLQRLAPLFEAWPRPILNDPRRTARLARDKVASAMAALPGVAAPRIEPVSHAMLSTHALPAEFEFPVLLRPLGSHAGQGLELLIDAQALATYLSNIKVDEYYISEFIDYRSSDNLFRKYRIAFIDGAPFLCHMAASEHWMVHYLNAGMTENADKRAMEAAAMASFDASFAHRHAAALAAVNACIGLDYYQIDCAETPDGRLLVFEADVAAIVHLMDPPDLFPYKRPQMRRVMRAFGDMLSCHAAQLTGEATAA